MAIAPVFELTLLAMTSYALFVALGLVGLRLLSHDEVTDSTGAVVVGMAVVQVVGWYNLDLWNVGVKSAYLVLTILGVVGALTYPFLRSEWRTSLLNLARDHWIALASILLFGAVWWPLLRQGYLTIAGGNGDVAAYAQVAQHIEHRGFQDTGRIVGGDLGRVAREDVSGAYMLIGFVKGLGSEPFNVALMTTMSVVVASLTQMSKIFLRRIFLLGELLASFVALLPQLTFMFVYLIANYFLGQIISMMAFIAVILSLVKICDQDPSPQEVRHYTLVLTAGSAVLVMSYPHMYFVVLGFVLLSLLPWYAIRGSFRVLRLVSISLAIGMLLCLEKVYLGAARFITLAGDTTNGWPLPTLSPIDLLGFTSSENSPISPGERLLSAGLVVALGAAGFQLYKRRPSARGILRLFALVLVSGLYFAWTSPDTYRNWKWATYFAPFFLVVSCGVILYFVRRSKAIHVAAICGIVLLLPSHFMRSRPYMTLVSSSTISVGRALAEIQSDPVLGQYRELNVSTGPYLASMWPALFLDSSTVHILEPSYYSAPRPAKAPTLVLAGGSIPVSRSVPIEGGYSLVPFPDGPTTDSLDGFESDVSVLLPMNVVPQGETLLLEVVVSNSGVSTWLGSGSFLGCVNLGVRAFPAASDGPPVELARVPIATFPDYVSPGESRVLRVEFQLMLDPGSYVIEVGPVVELLAWAGDVDPQFVSSLAVEVVGP